MSHEAEKMRNLSRSLEAELNLPKAAAVAEAGARRIEALEKERPCNGMLIADGKGGFAPFCNIKQRVEALEEALMQIRDQHIGDCPAALAHLSDEEWARRCHGHLRTIAREALKDGE